MQKTTISRDDSLYQAFADIARTPDGALVCTYRESLCHGPIPFSRVMVRRSRDGGRRWGPPQLVIERTREQTQAGQGRLNCPRLLACADGSLVLVVDLQSDRRRAARPAPGVHRGPGGLVPLSRGAIGWYHAACWPRWTMSSAGGLRKTSEVDH